MAEEESRHDDRHENRKWRLWVQAELKRIEKRIEKRIKDEGFGGVTAALRDIAAAIREGHGVTQARIDELTAMVESANAKLHGATEPEPEPKPE